MTRHRVLRMESHRWDGEDSFLFIEVHHHRFLWTALLHAWWLSFRHPYAIVQHLEET